jgi:hypothetical protein
MSRFIEKIVAGNVMVSEQNGVSAFKFKDVRKTDKKQAKPLQKDGTKLEGSGGQGIASINSRR